MAMSVEKRTDEGIIHPIRDSVGEQYAASSKFVTIALIRRLFRPPAFPNLKEIARGIDEPTESKSVNAADVILFS